MAAPELEPPPKSWEEIEFEKLTQARKEAAEKADAAFEESDRMKLPGVENAKAKENENEDKKDEIKEEKKEDKKDELKKDLENDAKEEEKGEEKEEKEDNDDKK